VQDERMGDVVKITVIATGFRQEMPERRARMLAESTLMSSDEEVPIWGRGYTPRDAAPRFASEIREARQAHAQHPVDAGQLASLPVPTPSADQFTASAASSLAERTTVLLDPDSDFDPDAGSNEDGQFDLDADADSEPAGQADPNADLESDADADLVPDEDSDSVSGTRSTASDPLAEDEYAGPQFDSSSNPHPDRQPELLPVAASVFDDEFFRTPRVRLRPPVSPGSVSPGPVNPNPSEPDTRDCSFNPQLQRAQSRPIVPQYTPAEHAPEVHLFAGASASHAEPAETDELDIPAFLRHSH
jgi:cell division protein FtsZ